MCIIPDEYGKDGEEKYFLFFNIREYSGLLVRIEEKKNI